MSNVESLDAWRKRSLAATPKPRSGLARSTKSRALSCHIVEVTPPPRHRDALDRLIALGLIAFTPLFWVSFATWVMPALWRWMP
jgi:hypothetical protein